MFKKISNYNILNQIFFISNSVNFFCLERVKNPLTPSIGMPLCKRIVNVCPTIRSISNSFENKVYNQNLLQFFFFFSVVFLNKTVGERQTCYLCGNWRTSNYGNVFTFVTITLWTSRRPCFRPILLHKSEKIFLRRSSGANF